MTSTTSPDSPQERKFRWKRHGLMSIGIIAVALIGSWFYLTQGRYVSTDNAYIKSQKILLSPTVSGSVVSVSAFDNQHVVKGQLLFEIDPQPYQIALQKAQADLASQVIEINELKAQYRQKQAELQKAQATARYSENDLTRINNLITNGAVSQIEGEDAKLTRDNAEQEVSKLQYEVAEILASLNNNPDILPENHPLYQAAQATFDQAAMNLDHSQVKAPADGVVGEMPNIGDYAQTALPIMNFIANKRVWIEANFKETDLTNVLPGQPVTIHIDMYPGHTWSGRVASISPATGAEFSLLPAQNSTGNWVKVVQRISTYIEVDPGPDNMPLRPGMSTEVEIDTGHYPHLPNQKS